MESYQRLIDVIAIENLQMRVEYWLLTQVLVWSTLLQAAAVLAALALAYLLSRPLQRRLAALGARYAFNAPVARGLAAAAASIALPVLALILLAGVFAVGASIGAPRLLLTTAINLLAAWIVIRLLTRLIRNDFWSRVVAILAFGVATLNILGLLAPTIVWLDQIGFRLGETHVSALDILRAAVELGLLLWLASVVAGILERRMQRAPGLTPSLKVLTSKLIRFSLITLALVIALTSTGIDLTAFALFTGALGVGIGFGLQKPISNLISGLILLFDRSIKPGDVVELTDPGDHSKQLFGWVTALNARYVSLTTRDGTEWLVPNEDLITRRVINWSYNHKRLRLLTPIGVSFDCDVRLAMQLAEEAARETPRVLQDPPPVCRLMGFGDSAVNLEMRFWIDDPANGIINVRSQVLLTLWEKFRAHEIRTPLGHRDLYIKPELRADRPPQQRTAPVGGVSVADPGNGSAEPLRPRRRDIDARLLRAGGAQPLVRPRLRRRLRARLGLRLPAGRLALRPSRGNLGGRRAGPLASETRLTGPSLMRDPGETCGPARPPAPKFVNLRPRKPTACTCNVHAMCMSCTSRKSPLTIAAQSKSPVTSQPLQTPRKPPSGACPRRWRTCEQVRRASPTANPYMRRMDRRSLLLALAALPLAAAYPAAAQSVNVSAINTYLTGLRSAQGRFTQTNPDRSAQTGTFYLQKPGRIRFEYDKPKGAMVIADGTWVGVFDPKSNRNPTRYPLNKTPLSLLLRDRLSLAEPGLVQGAVRDAGGTAITVVDPRMPKEGRMVMSFSEAPIQLRQWVVTTKTGQSTRVALSDIKAGVELNRSLFNIELAATKYR